MNLKCQIYYLNQILLSLNDPDINLNKLNQNVSWFTFGDWIHQLTHAREHPKLEGMGKYLKEYV